MLRRDDLHAVFLKPRAVAVQKTVVRRGEKPIPHGLGHVLQL